MEDYLIKSFSGAECGVTAQTERARNRNPGSMEIGHTLVFKSRSELLQYVKVAEAEGFTFAGKHALDWAQVFRGRLQELFRLCDEVPSEEGAHLKVRIVVEELFIQQMSSGQKVKLPTATLRGGVEIQIRSSGISANFTGDYYGSVSVDRKLVGAGRLDSPSCWTALSNFDDPAWYAGAVGDKATLAWISTDNRSPKNSPVFRTLGRLSI